jgi:TonB family protein
VASIDSAVYDDSQVTEGARLRLAPVPFIPPAYRHCSFRGEVMVAAIVEPSGAVDSVRVIRSFHPSFDSAAAAWVRGASFSPACRDGRPVRVRIIQPVTFAMLYGSQCKF